MIGRKGWLFFTCAAIVAMLCPGPGLQAQNYGRELQGSTRFSGRAWPQAPAGDSAADEERRAGAEHLPPPPAQIDLHKLPGTDEADLFSLPVFEGMARGPLRVVRWRY